MIATLDQSLWFPNPCDAGSFQDEVGGLIAVGGDLSVPRLLLAYRSGLFPWSEDPITWWSPDPRAVLDLHRVHIGRTLNRKLRQARFRVTHDLAFADVMAGCAAPGRGRERTWISAQFQSAYVQLHREGYAHSVECWLENRLVGGVYGVAIRGLFAGESMFCLVPEASKVALVHLLDHLRSRGFALFDLQMVTPVTERMGGYGIRRKEYLRRLDLALDVDTAF